MRSGILRQRREGNVAFLKRSGGAVHDRSDRDVEWTSGDVEVEVENNLLAPVVRSSLGPDTVVTGRLSFTTPTRIDGTLRGEVRATDLLVIGEQGYVDGIVRCRNLIVLGEVRGEVRGAERVEIAPGGRLLGLVETRGLVVRDGGCLDGDCSIAPGHAPVRALQTVPAAESA
jgi:cytoskeletal protein CcmA (bactofilin family)